MNDDDRKAILDYMSGNIEALRILQAQIEANTAAIQAVLEHLKGTRSPR